MQTIVFRQPERASAQASYVSETYFGLQGYIARASMYTSLLNLYFVRREGPIGVTNPALVQWKLVLCPVQGWAG
jgi:hypothetical protein